MTRLVRALAVAAALAAALAVAVLPAAGQEQGAPTAQIREIALDEDGTSRVIVSVTGDGIPDVLPAQAFSVTEGGQPVPDLDVEPLLESQAQPVTVALLIDVSGSTEGEPLANAKAAATQFVSQVLDQGVRVGVIAFSGTATLVTDFTGNRQALVSTIGGLEASGDTALYDAVALAATELSDLPGQRNIILFSDGGDTVSQTTLEAALQAAQDAAAPVTSVALVTDELDQGALDRLAAGTEGRSLSAADAGQLAGAFEQVARQLASQYVLTYQVEPVESAELDLAVTVSVSGQQLSDSATVLNPRVAAPPPAAPLSPPPPAQLDQPLIGFLGSDVGLWLGIGAAFLSIALIAGLAVVAAPGGTQASRALKRGVEFYSREGAQHRQTRRGARGVVEGAVSFFDRMPKPEGFEERLQFKLEQAGWPLRTSEFLAIQAGATIGGGALTFALTRNLLVTLVVAVVGFAGPYLVLSQRVAKRERDFLDQLPDTLQILANSLRAGHGLLQAVDTVVQEAPEPTSTEFTRVLTEARLGMPLDEALEAMAVRVGSEDFRWVVLAINIQRQVGGNLALLLETVSNTLREREQVRRQIRVLSAEGKLSAIILVVLPIALALYMLAVNPQYILELTRQTLGWVMIGGAVVLMVLGSLWMRKLVKIDV